MLNDWAAAGRVRRRRATRERIAPDYTRFAQTGGRALARWGTGQVARAQADRRPPGRIDAPVGAARAHGSRDDDHDGGLRMERWRTNWIAARASGCALLIPVATAQ